MGHAHLIDAHDFVTIMDYGQFNLWTDAWDPQDLDTLALVMKAQQGENIAQERHCLLIICPHQANFEMPLRFERWSAAPDEDLSQWQEAYEAHLSVGDFDVYYNTPTFDDEGVSLPVPPGEYHALITGRGFVAHGWPGSTTPGDEWRIRLWPSAGPIAPRRLLAWKS